MAKDPDRPPFYFRSIMTDKVVLGLPGAKERLARRRSFVARFLRRALRRSTYGRGNPTARVEAIETLEKTAKMWLTASHAYKSDRIDSVIRYIGGLRAPVEFLLVKRGDPDTVAKVRRLLRRAWRDAKHELTRRLEAINDNLLHANPARSPDSFYWLEASSAPDARTWDDEAIALVAQEVRDIYARLVLAKTDLKFIALYADDLRWLVDHGGPAGDSLSFVPSNRALKAKLRGAEQLRVALNGRARKLLASSLGSRVRAELERRES